MFYPYDSFSTMLFKIKALKIDAIELNNNNKYKESLKKAKKNCVNTETITKLAPHKQTEIT